MNQILSTEKLQPAEFVLEVLLRIIEFLKPFSEKPFEFLIQKDNDEEECKNIEENKQNEAVSHPQQQEFHIRVAQELQQIHEDIIHKFQPNSPRQYPFPLDLSAYDLQDLVTRLVSKIQVEILLPNMEGRLFESKFPVADYSKYLRTIIKQLRRIAKQCYDQRDRIIWNHILLTDLNPQKFERDQLDKIMTIIKEEDQGYVFKITQIQIPKSHKNLEFIISRIKNSQLVNELFDVYKKTLQIDSEFKMDLQFAWEHVRFQYINKPTLDGLTIQTGEIILNSFNIAHSQSQYTKEYIMALQIFYLLVFLREAGMFFYRQFKQTYFINTPEQLQKEGIYELGSLVEILLFGTKHPYPSITKQLIEQFYHTKSMKFNFQLWNLSLKDFQKNFIQQQECFKNLKEDDEIISFNSYKYMKETIGGDFICMKRRSPCVLHLASTNLN